MKLLSFKRACFSTALISFAFAGLMLAAGLNNNEVEFTGTISSLVVNGEGVGTLFIRFDDLDLRVVVTSGSSLEDQDGESIAMSDLTIGDAVKVRGKFSSSGILATEVRLLAKTGNNFQLRGRITGIQVLGANTLISLLGVTVVVNSDTRIDLEGSRVPASDLRTGMFVQVEGTISENTWTATSVKIIPETRKKDEVRFEGTIREVKPDLIRVEVDGVTNGLTTVLLNPNTRIVGDLVAGALVQVRGTLNADLSVTAREVRVLPALEIKPEERKLKVGVTASFTVKLRETASGDVRISLTSSAPAVLALSTNSVTVPKGSKTADFSATALKTGSATITAEALGQKALAQVRVGEISEDENERPAGEVRIVFAPEKVKMGLNDTRDVVLLIKPPQRSPVSVQLTVKNSLVTVVGSRDFNNGAAALKLTLQSGLTEGTDSVTAALPTSLGGGKAELLVEVSAKKDGENERETAEIVFRPEEIKLDVDETRSVNLLSSRSFDTNVTVAITSGGAIAQAPSTVVLPAGSKSARVSVTGKAEGKISLTAALPADLGGDTARLEVEVRNRK